MTISIEKLKKIIDTVAELIKDVLEEILPIRKNDGGKDEKK
jgi:hypothetical protein